MKLLKFTFLSACFVISFFSANAQNTAISDVSYTPDASAVLDVYSTSKGFLVPRLTQVERLAIVSPATGLLVFQTDGVSGFYFYDGSGWVSFLTGNAGTVAWVPDGNTVSSTKSIGTISNYDLPVITNGVERMRITNNGAVGIGSTAFSLTNPEKLMVDYGATSSSTIAKFKGSIDSYLELNLQNQSDGVNASTDFIATADNGTDSTYYVDMGINSSNYSPGVENFGGPNDAYLYSSSRHLLVGTAESNSDLIFLVGGGQIATNTAMRIDCSTRNVVIGRRDGATNPNGNTLRGPNAGGTNINGGDLTVKGGAASGSGTGGNLILVGGGTTSGSLGSVNISANTNSAVNIGTGTSNQNVTIGGTSNNVLFPKINSTGAVFYSANTNGQLAGSALFCWDNTNTRLGINTATPTAGLDVNSNFKLGNGGTVLTKVLKTSVTVTNTTTFNYTAIRVITATVTGASVNSSVIVNPRANLPTGIGLAYSYISAANTLTMVFTNTDATARAVGSNVVFDVTVIN